MTAPEETAPEVSRPRNDGWDHMRTQYRNLRCGIDECKTALRHTAWKGDNKRLYSRILWQLSTHKPAVEDSLKWASASRILGVRVADLRAVYDKFTPQPKPKIKDPDEF